jgi:hypothetical protein
VRRPYNGKPPFRAVHFCIVLLAWVSFSDEVKPCISRLSSRRVFAQQKTARLRICFRLMTIEHTPTHHPCKPYCKLSHLYILGNSKYEKDNQISNVTAIKYQQLYILGLFITLRAVVTTCPYSLALLTLICARFSRRRLNVTFALLRCYAALTGRQFPTFRGNLSVPYSRVKQTPRPWRWGIPKCPRLKVGTNCNVTAYRIKSWLRGNVTGMFCALSVFGLHVKVNTVKVWAGLGVQRDTSTPSAPLAFWLP